MIASLSGRVQEVEADRLVIDLGPGRHIVLGILDEYNPRAVAGWLEPICAEIGAQVYTMDTGKLSSISVDA